MKKWGSVLGLLLLVSSASGQDVIVSEPEAPIPAAPLAEGEAAEEAANIAIATPTPLPNEAPADDHVVEPLDSWYVVPSPTATPSPKPNDPHRPPPPKQPEGASNGEGEFEEEEIPELESVETDAQLPESAANKAALDTALKARRVQLTKSQKQRIRQARLNRSRVMRETEKQLGLTAPVQGDTRGEAELRACTLNLNSYGTADDFRRIFKAAQLPRRERIESSVLAAIEKGRCDIVAVQSVLGVTNASAELGMKQFLRKLTARLGGEWEAVLAQPKREIVRSGFLVRSDKMEIIKRVSYHDVALTSFGPFKLKEFSRAPYQLTVEVPGKGTARSRKIIFLTYDFHHAFVSTSPEPETHRMQMADGVRSIIHTEEQSHPPEDPPIVVLLGDRVGPQRAPATQLLEGRWRLIDFTQNGGCTLTPENTVGCKQRPVHFKEFFGVSAEGYVVAPKVKTKKEEDEEKRVLVYPSKAHEEKLYKAQREKTSEVYLKAADLVCVQADMHLPGRYRTGTVPVRTGLAATPLVWAELNW